MCGSQLAFRSTPRALQDALEAIATRLGGVSEAQTVAR